MSHYENLADAVNASVKRGKGALGPVLAEVDKLRAELVESRDICQRAQNYCVALRIALRKSRELHAAAIETIDRELQLAVLGEESPQ